MAVTELHKDPWIRGLVALHNLSGALEAARSLPVGSPGFPAQQDPLVHVERRLQGLMQELCAMIRHAERVLEKDGGD